MSSLAFENHWFWRKLKKSGFRNWERGFSTLVRPPKLNQGRQIFFLLVCNGETWVYRLGWDLSDYSFYIISYWIWLEIRYNLLAYGRYFPATILFLLQNVFLPILRASVWFFPYYYAKLFFLILKIHVLQHQDLKDLNSYVSVNPT